MSVALPGGLPQSIVPPEPGLAPALARRMPHLCVGFAALLLGAWWLIAAGTQEQPRQPPPPAQQDTGGTVVAGACDACGGCDLSVCDCAGEACSGCDVSCDCVAVPPGAIPHTLDVAGPTARPCGDRRGWAGLGLLGLLVPLAVMLFWRRRR